MIIKNVIFNNQEWNHKEPLVFQQIEQDLI